MLMFKNGLIRGSGIELTKVKGYVPEQGVLE